ncbi:MAG: hypothetical protein VX777_10010 [Chlamydiota bacterium]|nr:hypothetical protein [Chlamydiota bacterium]
MFRSWLLLISSLLTFTQSYAKEELIYLPNKPTTHNSRMKLTLFQSLPGIKVDAAMDQKLDYALTIVDRSDLPVSQPPINMLFDLKNLQVELKSNGTTISYDVKNPETSIFLAEVNNIIDKPIKLHFDKNFQLKGDTPDIAQLTKELPILGNLHPRSFINELFQHLFALAEKKLAVGEVYSIEPPKDSAGIPPKIIQYTVTKITDDTITATIKGQIEEEKYNMGVEVTLNKDSQETVGLSLYGDLNGEVTWNRKNALDYTLHTETNYLGTFNVATWEWTMEASLIHDITTIKELNNHEKLGSH